MLVLGIESATPVASVALVDEIGLLAEMSLNVGLTHSEQLLPMIDNLLSQCRRNIKEVTCIGVSAGPGSYTGLRIGMATAKALAQGIGAAQGQVYLISVPTLEAMAWALRGQKTLASPVLNARRGQIYAGLYAWRDSHDVCVINSDISDINGLFASRQRGKKERMPAGADSGGMTLECLISPVAVEPADWAARVGAFAKGSASVCLLGEGAALYKEIWARDLGDRAFALPPVAGLCRGAYIALTAMEMMAGRDRPEEFYDVKPIYLRGI